MNKRPDASGALKFLTILSGISSVILLLVAFYVSVEDEYLAGTFWGVFAGSLVTFAGMFIVNGFHNVLLDIRDQKYEHTAILKSIRDAVDGGKAAAEEAAAEAERLNRWKDKWHRRIDKEVAEKQISVDFAKYIKERINSLDSVPEDDTEWHYNMVNSFQDTLNSLNHDQNTEDSDLAVWKDNYIHKVKIALENGTISKEKAEAIIAKVNAYTKIPEGQK